MVGTSGFTRHLTVHLLCTDTVHGGFCAVLTIGLVLVGMPLWLVLGLPLIAYIGLHLLVVPNHWTACRSQHLPSSDRATYALCVNRRDELWALSVRIDDAELRDSLHAVSSRID